MNLFVVIFGLIQSFIILPQTVIQPDLQINEKQRSSTSLEIVAVLHHDSALKRPHDIEIKDGIAYLAGKGGSITVMDIKDAANPKLLWYECDKEKYNDAETVMPLSHNRLLIGTRDLWLFDITNPSQPAVLDFIGDVEGVDLINGFIRHENIVFGCNKQGYFFAVDVSDPDKLKVVGTYETRERGELEAPHDIALCGKMVVVVSPQGFNDKPGRIAVYQVFDNNTGELLPSDQWKQIGNSEDSRLAGANRIMIQENLACVTSSLSINVGRKDVHRANLSVVDLSKPTKPRIRGTIDFPDKRGPNGLEWVENTVYIAGGQTVQCIDVTKPDKPIQKAVLFSPEAFPGGRDDGHDLVLVDNHLFVTAQSSNSLIVVRIINNTSYK